MYVLPHPYFYVLLDSSLIFIGRELISDIGVVEDDFYQFVDIAETVSIDDSIVHFWFLAKDISDLLGLVLNLHGVFLTELLLFNDGFFDFFYEFGNWLLFNNNNSGFFRNFVNLLLS